MANIVTAKNVSRMRAKLANSTVPIQMKLSIGAKRYEEEAVRLNSSVSSNDYMPSNTLGYLGYPKKDGCTRFVPILSAADTTLYYSIVWALEDELILDIPGVFGAWHTKPDKVGLSGAKADGGHDDVYSSNTFNKNAWFTEWKSFSDLLSAILQDHTYGNFVLTTDIANFYDTIDVARLCDQIRSTVNGSHEIVSLLRFFLQYWDRRVKGYVASSKGIPQELISDASRTLANFYLRDFDLPFKEMCESADVTYVRWADDILLIGNSRKKLEEILHRGSRILLSLGLNFNASKTRHFTRKEYRKYRGLSALSAANSATAAQFEKEVRAFERHYSSNGGRIDSILRASISRLYRDSKSRTTYLKNFVEEHSRQYYLCGLLDERQLFRLCAINANPSKEFSRIVRLIDRYPYASVKAALLESVRKHKRSYISVGVSEKTLKGAGEVIEKSSSDSEIVRKICLPVFKAAF